MPPTVPVELLEALAVTAPADPGPVGCKAESRQIGDVGAWLRKHGLEPQEPIDWNNALLWRILCPWNSDHGHSAYLIRFPRGGIAHGCHHESCAGKTCKDLRELKEGIAAPADIAQLLPEVELLLQRAKETLDPAHAFLAARLLAQLPAADVGTLTARFKAALGDKLNLNHFSRAIKEESKEGADAAPQGQEVYSYELGNQILEENHFARDQGGKLYVYRGGVYRAHRPTADRFILDRVEELVIELGKQSGWNPRLAKDVVEWVRGAAPDLVEHPPVDRINLLNGILDLTTMELAPHSPELLLSIQIPVTYDPAATCRMIDDFLKEVFPEDSIMLAWEILGDLLTPERSIQKAILLMGEGGGGKSTFLALAIAFVGRENVSNLSLHRLESDRFSAANLYRRLADICPDLPSEHLTSTSLFKAVTGNDTITGEYKFLTSFSFTPYCRLLFSANHPPVSKDASKAFFDRWVVIPFERSIRGTQQEIPRNVLHEVLTAPDELSGALNKALVGLRRVRNHGRFTETESTRRAMTAFQEVTDPLSVWLDRETILEPAAIIAKNDLVTAYNQACEHLGRPPVTRTAFSIALQTLRKEIKDAQRTVGGKPQTWVWLGIALRAPASQVPPPVKDSRGSRGSRGLPILVPHGKHPPPPLNRI